MSAYWLFAAALASLACSAEGYIASYRDDQALLLPIEVLGQVGTEESRDFVLDAASARRAKYVALTVHGVSDPSEATLVVNGESTYQLSNDSVTLPALERSFGGIGSFSTLHMRLPLATARLRAGSNRLTFRFDGGDGTSIGFRVLELNLLDEELEPLLDAARFRQDDPSNWAAPDPASESSGLELWSSATLLDVSSQGPRPLRAHCGDCHAADGRDLKYFNYSNRAIVERSRFYGLSEAQGLAIASYIRNLDLPAPGRPWDPPYQPGPGLDEKAAENWSAGAGRNAVLDQDQQMVEQLFPDGSESTSLAPDATLNLRELRIALELPDWNRWLCRIHPLDAWGDEFEQNELNLLYTGSANVASLPSRLERGGARYVNEQFPADQKVFTYARADFLRPRTEAAESSGWPFEERVRIQSVHQWQMVKLWELSQRFDLEVDARELYGEGAEARSWLGGRLPQQFGLERPGSELSQQYLRAAWFYLQLLLNPGNRVAVEHEAVDWVSTYRGQPALYEQTAVAEPYRVFAMLVKGTQQATNGIGPADPSRGWTLERAEAGILLHPLWEPNFAPLASQERRALLEAYLRGFMNVNERYPAESYARDDGRSFPPADYQPTGDPQASRVDAIRYMIPKLRELGVDQALIDRMCAWAEQLWPLGDWETLH